MICPSWIGVGKAFTSPLSELHKNGVFILAKRKQHKAKQRKQSRKQRVKPSFINYQNPFMFSSLYSQEFFDFFKTITFITRLYHDNNVPSFCNNSTTTRGGKVHIHSASRTRQSKLLIWSAKITPLTGKPSGMRTSKG